MSNERIVFMGTPIFGKAILQTLVECGCQVVGVVTQPDKLVGRKQILTFSPCKEYALSQGIEVFQPQRIRNDYQRVLDWKPDLILTCAYGQIIPKVLLDAPSLGCINVHASLLPKLRGGAPIQHAIIDGYQKTGITIMEMAEKMDNGAMIAQRELVIGEDETYHELHDRLIVLACQLLKDTLDSLLSHDYTPVQQDEQEVTFGYNITKEEEHLDLTKSYQAAYDQIRGLCDGPYAYLTVQGKKLKLCRVHRSDINYDAPNGTFVFVDNGLGLVMDQRLILIDEVQPEGKNRMAVRDFRNGSGRDYHGRQGE